MRYKTSYGRAYCPELNQDVGLTIELGQSDNAALNSWKVLSVPDCSCNRYNDCSNKDKGDRCPAVLELANRATAE